MLLLILNSFLLTRIITTYAILAYDCGGTHLNTTTISLLRTGDCDLKLHAPVNTTVYIQLLQLSTYNHAEVIQCKVGVSRTIYHCGMHSHVSIVHNGQASYLLDVTYNKCVQMHTEGIIKIGISDVIDNLKPNQTHYRSVTLAGKIGIDGTCKGTQYSDFYGTWEDVVVQAQITITLRTAYVPVNLKTGHVILKSGTICVLTDGHCVDSDDGHTFWQSIPVNTCNFDQYDVLYEGTAMKLKGESDPITTVVYTLNTRDTTFALTVTKPHIICGYSILGTEHPKLFIFETQRGNTFKTKTETATDNLDIFAYVNSKFIYVEKHIRDQMTALYHDILIQKCELERQVLQNTLSIAALLPDEFAYRITKQPGHMAVAAGEVIHIIKCLPVEAVPRQTNSCYIEFPVTVRNSSYFITPKSRILTRYGTTKECNPILPVQYYFENSWVEINPTPLIVSPPQELKPLTALTWQYKTPRSLATSGIYSERDIEKLRNHIMFPAEKSAVLYTIAQGYTGQNILENTGSLHNLLDEEALNKIYISTASKIWSGFITFGTATAGVFGIFLVVRIIKIIFDTMIHGYALHSAYGCSIHLLGAIWSSLTHLLLHLANKAKPVSENKNNESRDTSAPTTSRTRENCIETQQPHTSAIPVTYTFSDLQSRLDDTERIPQFK